MPDDVRCEVVAGAQEDVVLLTGPVSMATVPVLRAAVAKALAARGRAVADLSGLVLEWEPAATLFATALAAAGGWPAARLALHGASPELRRALQRARVTESVPLAADRDAARALLDVRPARVSRHLDLPVDAGSPATARAFVAALCGDWDLPATAAPAVQVVDELVSNAVVHARTACRVVVTLDPRGLRLGVRDFGPPAAVRARPAPVDLPGRRGLHLVELLSRRWGVRDEHPGRVVWAELAPG
jgi:anti-sigma regulatory factor (Ser/Thr protein kinase)